MHFKNLDLIGVIFIVGINVGWTQIPSRPLLIGVILAVPLIFVLPGYTLTQALFHKRSTAPSSNLILQPRLKIGQPVSAIDYITLSLGLSMAIDVLIGFILNILPVGLQTLSWTISLGLVTTVFTLLAAYFRRGDRMKVDSIPRPRITISTYILFGLAILVATAAVWFSLMRPPATQAYFTQFWMLPSNQTANSCTVHIGAQSFEASSVTYRITLSVNGEQINTWPSVVLTPQEKWDRLVPIPRASTNSIYVEADLYKLDKSETVYHEVHMTLNVFSGINNQKNHC